MQGSGFRVQAFKFQGSGFRIEGLGFRVSEQTGETVSEQSGETRRRDLLPILLFLSLPTLHLPHKKRESSLNL